MFWMFPSVLSQLIALIMSWNVKGLGCSQKRSRVRDFLKLYCIDIVLLQETTISFLRSIGGSIYWFESSEFYWLRVVNLLVGGIISLIALAN